jgi:hypothetical protein
MGRHSPKEGLSSNWDGCFLAVFLIVFLIIVVAVAAASMNGFFGG